MSIEENEGQLQALNEAFRGKLCDLIEEYDDELPAVDMIANLMVISYGVSREVTASKDESLDLLYDMLEEIESDEDLSEELLAEEND